MKRITLTNHRKAEIMEVSSVLFALALFASGALRVLHV